MNVARLVVLIVILARGTAAFAAPPACTDPQCSEKALEALHLLPADNPIAVPYAVSQRLTDFLMNRQYGAWRHDLFPRTNDIRLTGPFVDGVGLTTHARVRVFYSMGAMSWLEGGRQGPAPDGSMIVKEMFALPETVKKGQPEPISGWAVLVRDSSVSRDGWLWVLYYLPDNQTNQIEFQTVQYGMSFCVSCHISSDAGSGTFAFLGNVQGHDVATYVATEPVVKEQQTGTPPNPRAGAHGAFASSGKLRQLAKAPSMPVVPAIVSLLDRMMYTPTQMPNEDADLDLWRLLRGRASLPPQRPSMTDLTPLPRDAVYDHVLPPPQGREQLFLTSDVCSGCHDATNLLNTVDPHMTVKIPAPSQKTSSLPPEWYAFAMANVSPYGEWSGSLMSVSGRDPVFRAQLESEVAKLAAPASADVQELCMSCHQVMGARSFPKLARVPGGDYAIVDRAQEKHDRQTVEKATFGGLARDGVSCTVCHHIASTNLGKKKSFTAHFDTGPAGELYGPFPDPKTFPMEHALGMKPTSATQIRDPGLCGSCHVVEVPVYSADGKLVKRVYEQTTYMEWANSVYASDGVYASKGSKAQTCQDCHMPRTNPVAPNGEPLLTQIANIEDTTFPYVPQRADSAALDVVPREGYRRHTLTAINVFTMAMFQQFPFLLGSSTYLPSRAPNVLPPKMLAIEEARQQASQRTAKVHIDSATASQDAIDVNVRVVNLAGHKLPSGVGFRRAFIELSVLDAAGDVLWCSGCTDDLGVIVDANAEPLASEFAVKPGELQPDYSRITSPSQVQIYESRHVDCEGDLTTSFVHLCKEVKDNRLLPQGWTESGRFAKETQPVGLAGPITPGVDQIAYRIKRSEVPEGVAVRATLHYQSIPPYYLVDRASLLGGAAASTAHPETRRLLYIALHLDVADPQVGAAQWKLPIGCSQHMIGGSEEKPCS